MSNILKNHDARINEIIGHRLISKTEGNSIIKFSSERLLISLITLGIPIVETLSVLELVEDLLRDHKNKHPKEEVTTLHLREIVFQALHGMDPSRYSRSDVEAWGNAYARRFGNPGNRISVIQEDGNNKHLTFGYLTEQFIPDLISHITCMQAEQWKSGLVSNKDIQRIANEILSVVQYMHVYEIHHETLFAMAKDIALNPPHPWMVDRAFDESLIVYDLERAGEHVIQMRVSFEEEDYPTARHKCMECLEHSSSALLAYYGVFMGVKPFHNLIRVLKLSTNNPLLWDSLKIRQLEGDLSAIGESFLDFQKLLSKTEKFSDAYRKERLSLLIDHVERVYRCVEQVLTHRKMVERIISQTNQLDNLDEKTFETTIEDVFSSVPHIKKRNPIHKGFVHGCWFHHDIQGNGIFSKIEPRMFVATIYDIMPASKEQFDYVFSYFEDNRHLCNTVFIVCNCGFSKECIDSALQATKQNDRHVVLVNIDDLRRLYHAQDRPYELGEIVLGFYDQI